MNKQLLKKLARRQEIFEQVLWASRDAHDSNTPYCFIPQSPYARKRLLDRGITVPSSHNIHAGSSTIFCTYATLPSYL